MREVKLAEFLEAYSENDNLWWTLDSGDMQNLFEQAVDDRNHWKIRALRAEEWNRQQAKENK